MVAACWDLQSQGQVDTCQHVAELLLAWLTALTGKRKTALQWQAAGALHDVKR